MNKWIENSEYFVYGVIIVFSDVFNSSLLQVKAFLTTIVVRTIPMKVWGSHRNQRTFISNVVKFTTARINEKLFKSLILRGISMNDCDFTRKSNGFGRAPLTLSQKKEDLIRTLLFWLVESYISPIVKRAFFVTETQSGGNHVFFYRKNVFSLAQEEAVNKLVKTTLKPLTEQDATELLNNRHCLGLGRVRFIPKTRYTHFLLYFISCSGVELSPCLVAKCDKRFHMATRYCAKVALEATK